VLADREQAKRALTVASVLVVVAIGVIGYLSTGFFSALCGIERGNGYCERVGSGGLPIEELCLVLAPVALAAWAGVLSVRRGSPRLLLRASFVIFPLALLLPPILMAAWK
jgi:hypothetical protein